MTPGGRIRTIVVAVGMLATAFGAAPVSAVQAQPYPAAILDTDPTSGVTATAIRFGSGSADDPRGAEGTAALLSRVLQTQLTEPVRSQGASVDVEVGPDWTVVTLVAPSDRWTTAAERLVEALYDEALDPGAVERARAELVRILVFEAGAPVRDFEVELARMLHGELDDHARRSLGTPETVGTISLAGLEVFRSANLTPSNAVLAVSGPVDRVTVERVFGSSVEVIGEAATPGTPPPSSGSAPPPRLELYRSNGPELEFASAGAPAWAWDSAAREVVDRNITSTWISAATPLPSGAPRTLSEFFAHLVMEDLTPSPPDPGLYDATVDIVDIRGAPVLVVTASVDPQATDRWGERVTTVVSRLAAQPPEGAFFELTRRRFRSALVLELAVPEDRARWLARQIARQGDVRSSPEGEVWNVSREAISALAEAAGPSRILMYGPSLMMPQD